MRVRLEPSMFGDRWTAIDDDTYDGPGSPIGTGRTMCEAIEELVYQMMDKKLITRKQARAYIAGE